jgi:predicted nucleic-acid-binding Zn-ribbon protein
MKKTNQCPKCGSKEIIKNATPLDTSQYNVGPFMVAAHRRKESVILKGVSSSTVSAWVCVDCGFLELYANTPRNLIVKSPVDTEK